MKLSEKLPATLSKSVIGITIDGAGNAITAGLRKPRLRCPFSGTITKVTLLAPAGTNGDIIIDIWKDTYANYASISNANSITASAPPTISDGVKSEDATLTGWTTTVAEGDCFAFNVDAAATLTCVVLELEITRA